MQNIVLIISQEPVDLLIFNVIFISSDNLLQNALILFQNSVDIKAWGSAQNMLNFDIKKAKFLHATQPDFVIDLRSKIKGEVQYRGGGGGKARFNVATPTYATGTCTAHVLLYNVQTKSI